MIAVRYFCFCIVFISMMTQSAWAGNPGYAQPTLRDLARSVVLFKGVDLSNDEVMQEYTRIVHCDIYRRAYKNDFEWIGITEKIRGLTLKDSKNFRKHYELVVPLLISRYNFEIQAFPVHERSALDNVGVFYLHERAARVKRCVYDDYTFVHFPLEYSVHLKNPITITEVYVDPDRGRGFLERASFVEEEGVRVIYMRVRIKLVSFRSYAERSSIPRIEFNGEVETIDFYEDEGTSIYLASGPKF